MRTCNAAQLGIKKKGSIAKYPIFKSNKWLCFAILTHSMKHFIELDPVRSIALPMQVVVMLQNLFISITKLSDMIQ